MAERPRGMGRGLAAILAISPQDGVHGLRDLPLDVIEPNRSQPRRRFDEDALLALAESIRLRGVLQPVLVAPLPSGTYELIAGERRWRAARLAECQRIPAIIRECQDGASLELALIENLLREDLNPVEEAQACCALIDELGLTREEVGVRVGKSRVAVSNLLRLLELPDEALELLERGELREGHGRALLLAAEHDVRRRLAREAVARGWSVRELERRARAAAAGAPPAPGERRRARAAPAPRLHPDQEAAIEQISDAYGALLGADVEVSACEAGGYRVALSFDSLQEALEAARRLRPRAV